MWRDLFSLAPDEIIITILVSAVITLTSYSALPMFFAATRTKPLTKGKYTAMCFGANVIVFFALYIMNIVNGGNPSVPWPYFLWTSVFSGVGKKALSHRGLLTEARAEKKPVDKIYVYRTILWVEGILLGLLLIVLAVVMISNVFSGQSSDSWKPTAAVMETQPPLEKQPRPINGKLLHGSVYTGSEITVTADKYSDYVVSVKGTSGVTYVAFYVRAGETVTKGVPKLNLNIHFASGEDWYGYGKGKMFGEDTVYSKDDETLDFSDGTYTYTLYPVSNGNFSETPSDEDEFF